MILFNFNLQINPLDTWKNIMILKFLYVDILQINGINIIIKTKHSNNSKDFPKFNKVKK